MDTSAGRDETEIAPPPWEYLGPKLYRLDLLEAENKSLRSQLDTFLRKQQFDQDLNGGKYSNAAGRPVSQQTVPSSATVRDDARDSVENWKRKYEDLKQEHNSLQDKHASSMQEIKLKNEKLRQARDSVKAWKAYADKCRERDAKNARHSRPPSHASLGGSDDMTTTPRALAAVQINAEAALIEHEQTTKASSVEISSSPPRPKAGLLAALTTHSPARSAIARVTSSQTTVEESQQKPVSALPQTTLSSDSVPVLVSTRSLKRKARTSAPAEPLPRRIKQEPNSSDAPVDIKSEDFSSPHTTPTRASRTQASDLDNIGPLMTTPRRPHRNQDLRSRATSEEAARLPPTLDRTASSLSEGDAGAQDVTSAANTAAYCFAARQIRARPSGVTPAHNSSRSSGDVLQPISNNISIVAASRPDRAKPKARVRRTGAKDSVNLLSEAGDISPAKSKQGTRSDGNVTNAADTDHRLDYMLATQDSSRGQTPGPRRSEQAEHTSGRPAARASPHLPTPVSIIKGASPAKQRSPVKVPRGIQKPPPNVRPEDEHLRLKNVKELKPADFRINSKYMGTDFAWTDTLRGRYQRRGLHTCTDPACCGGAMQKAIEMAGTELSGKTDRQALEAFLGPNWEAEIGAYNTEKRTEVVKQAHIFCFSNQHGKHKTAFQRRNTPPGFWNTDFPTTQEDEMNRAQAKEVERREVEQRYREAMREGGRWKFRDE